MAKVKAAENVKIYQPGEIVNMFFAGYTLPMLIRRVKNDERTTSAEAKIKVERTIYEYYVRKGYEDE